MRTHRWPYGPCFFYLSLYFLSRSLQLEVQLPQTASVKLSEKPPLQYQQRQQHPQQKTQQQHTTARRKRMATRQANLKWGEIEDKIANIINGKLTQDNVEEEFICV